MPPVNSPAATHPHPVCAEVNASIAARQDELVETLHQWANLNTGSANEMGLGAFADVLRDYTDFLPSDSTTISHGNPPKPCGLSWSCNDGEAEMGLPRVLLNGHLDTVFGADHPFQSCVLDRERGRIHGPGVADMKGGLVILFAALRAFLETDLSDRIDWEVLLTFDEEVGSARNQHHLEQAAARHDLGITFESSPHAAELIRNRLGTGRIDVTCRGRAAHSGRNFADGRNAVLALSTYLLRINELNTSLPGAIINAASISSDGPVNVVPDLATAAINVRAPDAETQANLMQQLHRLADAVAAETACTLELVGGFTRPAKVADQATETLLQAWRQVGKPLGLDIHWRDTGGASDGNILQHAGLPNVDNLGAVGTHLHSEAEFAECASLVTRAQLVANFLVLLASGELDDGDGPLVDKLRQRRGLAT